MAGVDSGVETGVGQKKTGQGSIQVNSRQVCLQKFVFKTARKSK